jgi:hypothetical protein
MSLGYYLVILGYGLIDIHSIEDYNIGSSKLLKISGYNRENYYFDNMIIVPENVMSLIFKSIPVDNLYLSMYLSQYLTGEDMNLVKDLSSNL